MCGFLGHNVNFWVLADPSAPDPPIYSGNLDVCVYFGHVCSVKLSLVIKDLMSRPRTSFPGQGNKNFSRPRTENYFKANFKDKPKSAL